MASNCSLWVEKFRPETIKDVIMPKDFRNFFNKVIRSKDLPNLLLTSSTAGTGKTTVAKALAKDIGAETKYINASIDNGINVVRTIEEFASTVSNNMFNDEEEVSEQKVVILDEADGMSVDAQKALRAFIEKYPNACRFIFTCNFIGKIIPALQEGRTMVFEFEMNKKEYVEEMKAQTSKRIRGILKFEKIEYDDNIIDKFVDAYYPSVRKMISILQKYSWMKGKVDADILYFKDIGDELAKMILEKKLTEARKYINEHGLTYSDVFKFLFENVVPKMSKKGQAIILIADYEHKCSFSSDPSIQLAACIVELFSCI